MSANQLTTETRLKLAANAWHAKVQAEATIARLERYAHRSHAMQSDLFAAHHRLTEANSALSQLLRQSTLSPEGEAGVPDASPQPRSGDSLNHPCAISGDPS